MLKDVRAHYRQTGEVEEGQVCRNLMVTRVNDFVNRIDRCHVQPSAIHGDGLFASRSMVAGELITFFPGDALLVWEDGDRKSDMMIFFGAHVPQSSATQMTLPTSVSSNMSSTRAPGSVPSVTHRGETTLPTWVTLQTMDACAFRPT